jgi:hypothetical protein
LPPLLAPDVQAANAINAVSEPAAAAMRARLGATRLPVVRTRSIDPP